MSTAAPSLSRGPGVVLADLLPGALVRDAALVLGGAGLVGVAAQVAIPLGFTPVPLTLQTLAVLLTGAALGWRRGALSLGLYAVAGVAGVPWFAERSGGWSVAQGPSFGYVLGFLAAAALVGALAARGGDRTPARTALSMLAGNAVVYAVGVPWLMAVLHVGLAKGLAYGLVPFLLGDAIKLVAASALLPATWRLVRR